MLRTNETVEASTQDGRFASPPSILGITLVLEGRVQGIGMRPAIARLARGMGLTGRVRNATNGVEIQAEGYSRPILNFLAALRESLPPAAQIDRWHQVWSAPAGYSNFQIEESDIEGLLGARVPQDSAVCHDCLREVTDPADRRHAYPFTTCTGCGPRYSVIRTMPYDREATAMREFGQCSECQSEYEDEAHRRFHSQTNACPRCGPHLWLSLGRTSDIIVGEPAIEQAARELISDKIVAVKGLGGYQLLADANSLNAVTRLRERKQRPAKPLAVLVSCIEDAERLCRLSAVARRTLLDRSNPIVVAQCRPGVLGAASSIQGALNTLGVMLPTTPLLFELVKRAGKPLVCTSGNVESEPLLFENACAQAELADISDVWLHHNRSIVRPIDDSVVRVLAGYPVPLRLARGLAPLPLDLPAEPMALALGGHQKAAIALSNGRQAVLGPHVGDLENLGTRARYIEHVHAFCDLYGSKPDFIVHDSHPGYFTTAWATKQNVPTMPVQHHHAHIAAGMLDHGWLDRSVLGIAWDGTGYGLDGTIWGGEFLLATATDFRRVARLRPFQLPGGEKAIREPWRAALAVATESVGIENSCNLVFPNVHARQVQEIVPLLRPNRICPITSSAGRLFDAAAALILGVSQSAYEGHAAMLLEAACDESDEGTYNVALAESEVLELDWRPMIAQLWLDRQAGVAPERMAMRFHRGLAEAIAAVCRRVDALPIVLSGGVFQNRVLTELVQDLHRHDKHPLGTPRTIPPNDGGLAAGQLAIGLLRWKGGWRPRCA